jgi:hypothetical protein
LCELLAVVPAAARDLPAVALNHPDGILHDGDYLVLRVTPPAGLPDGHLYVVYLDQVGQLFSLRPNPVQPTTAASAGATLQLGVEEAQRRPDVRSWQAGSPFGPGLLLALFTRLPLSGWPPAETMRLGQVLPLLATSVADAELLWAGWRELETRPRA